MNTTENEIRDVPPANAPQGQYPYYIDEYQDYRGMNRFMLLIISATLLPWLFGGYAILGFTVTGWAWVVPLVISFFICLPNIERISFPIFVWSFWAVLLSVYYYYGLNNPYAGQNFLQMISPLIVGCAASTFRADTAQLEIVFQWISRLAFITLTLFIIRVPMIIVGTLPNIGIMAPEMIGLLLLGSLYASFYICGSYRHLYYYLLIILMTFVALVRGPMAAMLSCLPLNLAPIGIGKRFAICGCVIIFTIVIFNTERVQQRMFSSGSGEINEMHWNNPDLKKSGRSVFFDILWPRFIDNPIWGNGFNAYRSIFSAEGLDRALPHNDWLKLLHDIGIVGAGTYLCTMLLQIFLLVNIARLSTGVHQMVAYGAATAFVPYILIMFTDNVVLYVQFFGNAHFALIGIIYGAMIRDEI